MRLDLIVTVLSEFKFILLLTVRAEQQEPFNGHY